ncbi:MAG: hypothetical protein FWG91_03785 [Lachnospiraceae bacterium]|nr:hypothetical protein [Lachnospiraceae bacterium]
MDLYIPANARPQAEIFKGFGKNELMKSVIGMAGGMAAAVILYLFTGEIAWSILATVAVAIVSVTMCSKIDNIGQSVVDIFLDQARFNKSQKIYPYRYLDEWGGGG